MRALLLLIGLVLLTIGSLWNMAVTREPWLTISGLCGVAGALIILIGLVLVVLDRTLG